MGHGHNGGGHDDTDRDHGDHTYSDREEWQRYRAHPSVLPGGPPAQNLSFVVRLARAAAAYARQAKSNVNSLKDDLAKFLNLGMKDQKNLTREEFVEFKKSLEHSLQEVKAAVGRSAKDQKSLIEASNSENAEVMKRALRRLDEMSQDVKSVVDAGVRSQETSAETAEKIFKLIDELVSTLKEAPPTKASALLSRVQRFVFWPKKVSKTHELLSDYAILIGGICLITGLVDPKIIDDPRVEEALMDKFFPSTSPVLFEEIGRRTRELLYNDFAPEMSVLFEPLRFDGLFPSSFIKRSPLQIVIQHQLRLRQGTFHLDVSVDSTNNVSSLFSFPGALGSDYLPKVCLSYPFRDSSVTLDAFYEKAAVRASVSMHPVRGDALLSLSGLFGTKAFNLGGRMEVDSGNIRWNSYAVGGSISSSAFTAGFQYNNRDQLLVMMSHKLQEKSMVKDLMHRSTISKDLYTLFVPSPTSELTIGAQLIHCSTAQSTVAAVAIEYADPSSVLKFRLASSGVLSAAWKNKFGESLTLGVKGQVNVTDMGAAPRVGMSVGWNPSV